MGAKRAVLPSFSSGHDALHHGTLAMAALSSTWLWHCARFLLVGCSTRCAPFVCRQLRCELYCGIWDFPFAFAEKSAMRTGQLLLRRNEILLTSSCTGVQQLVDCVRLFRPRRDAHGLRHCFRCEDSMRTEARFSFHGNEGHLQAAKLPPTPVSRVGFGEVVTPPPQTPN